MARDNTIKIYRSGGNAAPPSFSADSTVGPTFGELAYVDGLTSLYIGMSGGGLLWIGAEVTGGSISQGLEYAVPTMKAVKDYVTGTQSGYFIVRGEDGLTQQIDLAGTLTITGGTGIDVLKSSSANTIIVTGLTATYNTWGVVKVNSGGPIVIDDNGLNIGTDKKLFTIQDEIGNTDTIGYDNTLTITGGRGIDVYRTATDTLSVLGATATSSTLGVASFSSDNFSVSNGAVSMLSGQTVFVVKTDIGPADISVGFGAGSGKGLTFVGVGPVVTSSSGNSVLIDVGLASTSVTGLAYYEPTDFVVTNGLVSVNANRGFVKVGDSFGTTHTPALKDTFSITGGPGIFTVMNTGANSLAIRGITASTSAVGVASFNSTYFSVSATGTVNLAGTLFSVRDEKQTSTNIAPGDTLTITGGPGINVFSDGTDRLAVQGITATSSALGVASFSSTHFVVTDGAVALATPYTITGDTVTASGALSVTRTISEAALNVRLGSTSLTGVASFDAQYFSVGNTGHVRITMVDGGTFT